jgi:hypothetical protein
MARARIRRERGRCSACRLVVEVVVLSPTARIAPQHPRPTSQNLVGCRGSGAVALDIFAEGPTT